VRCSAAVWHDACPRGNLVDGNPYLELAAILAGIHAEITDRDYEWDLRAI
jgi:hypothetical protein